MLWCIVVCFLCTFYALFPWTFSIFLIIQPCQFLFSDISHEISLRTLCCLTPFVQKYHPLNWGIVLTTLLFDNLIDLYPAHSPVDNPVLDVVITVMPVCRVFFVLCVVVVDVLTYSMEGEEHSSSRPISFGWLRVYFIMFDDVVTVDAYDVYFMLCRRCCCYLRACRTLVVDVLATTVLCCDVLLFDIVVWFIVDGDGDANLGHCFLRDV